MHDPSHQDDQLSLPLSRRKLIASGAVSLAAVTAMGRMTAPAFAASTADPVSFGSNASDPVPKAAYQKVFDNFTKQSGVDVEVNTVDHNTFQEQINNYLQGKPDDVFTWFAGYRMQFFAQRGLAGDISDVWQKIGSSMSPALKQASTGANGKQYFVPFYFYPWAVFYRKSVFKKFGYTAPKTLDQFIALSKRMQKDGLTPMAFADKDGWPAMGTFDYINMRVNGYDFHVRLMAGKESWESARVKAVFNTWRSILPYHQNGALGRTWQEAAQSLGQKKAGMYLLGSFVGQQFKGAAYNDLDFFAFPQINPKWGRDSVEAPIDGFMMSRKPSNEEGAKALLLYLAGGAAQNTYLGSDPNNIAASKRASTAKYNALQRKSAALIASSKHISQFLDRDTRPDFASTVMIPALQQFLKNPKDVNGLTKSIEKQKKAIFAA
jgi:multiple sugar transport system substrate-binding protein